MLARLLQPCASRLPPAPAPCCSPDTFRSAISDTRFAVSSYCVLNSSLGMELGGGLVCPDATYDACCPLLLPCAFQRLHRSSSRRLSLPPPADGRPCPRRALRSFLQTTHATAHDCPVTGLLAADFRWRMLYSYLEWRDDVRQRTCSSFCRRGAAGAETGPAGTRAADE